MQVTTGMMLIWTDSRGNETTMEVLSSSKRTGLDIRDIRHAGKDPLATGFRGIGASLAVKMLRSGELRIAK